MNIIFLVSELVFMTAYDIIREIEKLTSDEKKIVIEYIDSMKEKFEPTRYTPEDMKKLDQAQEEAHKGMNLSEEYEGEEAIQYLKKLRHQ